MTLQPLTEDLGTALLTWYRRAFLVNLPAVQRAGEIPRRTSGRKCYELSEIWDRGGGPAQNSRRPVPADERIYVLSSRPPVWNDIGLTSVWRVHASPQGIDHPCPFPVEIPRRCAQIFSDPDGTVLDPFMGSGTTGVACANLGRKFIGIEIERKYFDIACERIDNAYRQKRMFA
jgi:hypothetical protein